MTIDESDLADCVVGDTIVQRTPRSKHRGLYFLVRDGIRRRPCILIALAIQLLIWPPPLYGAFVFWNEAPSVLVFGLFGVALFVPHAIRRWDVKHFAWMAGLGLIAPFVVNWI